MKKVIKYRPFGDYKPGEDYNTVREYICSFDWPEKTSFSCGSNGVVLKSKDSYNTAFFELYYKDNFIRGEGETIEKSEEKAWEKLNKMLTCEQHSFVKKENNERNVTCEYCGYKVHNYFPPENKCSTCGKKHIMSKIGDTSYCLEHFLENISKEDLTINENVIEGVKKDVFADIIDMLNNPEKQDLIFHCAGVKKYKKAEDIPNDNIYVEMKISEMKKMAENKIIAEYILKSGLLNEFNEYELIDTLDKMRDFIYKSSVEKSVNMINETIVKMSELGELGEHFNKLSYMNGNDPLLDELIETYKLIFIKYVFEKELCRTVPELHKIVFNKAYDLIVKEMEEKIMLDILVFMRKS